MDKNEKIDAEELIKQFSVPNNGQLTLYIKEIYEVITFINKLGSKSANRRQKERNLKNQLHKGKKFNKYLVL
jgi:uncharacterized membrane protein